MFNDPLIASSFLALASAVILGGCAFLWFKLGKKKSKASKSIKEHAQAVVDKDRAEETAEGESQKKVYESPSIEEVAPSETDDPTDVLGDTPADWGEAVKEYEAEAHHELTDAVKEMNSGVASEYEMPTDKE